MNKIVDGKYTFEIIDYVPYGYVIWNVGKNMIDGYLPIVQLCGEDGCQVNTETMKAIKLKDAQIILAAIGWGQNTIKQMETYVKRYKNSKRKVTQRHVERLKAALKVMYLIDWKN
jgi:hypothetical protein